MSGDPWSIEEYLALIHRPANIAVSDGILRYTCRSRKDSKKTYIVELDSYGGQGACTCKDFGVRFEPLLKRGLTGRQAFEQGFIKELRPYQFSPDESLMCFHIAESRREFANAIIQGVMKMEQERAAKIHAHVA